MMTYGHWKSLGHKCPPPAWMILGGSWRENQFWKHHFAEADRLSGVYCWQR